MGAKLGSGDDEPISDINITPFVDIVLVVLIIFMVTATAIVKQSIKVNLPDAATGESSNSSLALTLDATGSLFRDGEPITWDQLRPIIREARAEDPEVICLLAADAAVPHGDVVKLIDVVKQEGVARFALNIDPVELPAEASGPAP